MLAEVFCLFGEKGWLIERFKRKRKGRETDVELMGRELCESKGGLEGGQDDGGTDVGRIITEQAGAPTDAQGGEVDPGVAVVRGQRGEEGGREGGGRSLDLGGRRTIFDDGQEGHGEVDQGGRGHRVGTR